MEDWILINYLAGKAISEEDEAVRRWLAEDPSNQDHIDQLGEIWERTDSYDELESVDIQQDWNNVKARIGFEKENRAGTILNMYPLMKIAALIVLIVIPAILLELKFDILGSGEIAWITEATDNLQKELRLSDGSSITLNIDSEISYPPEFDKKKREVRLNGEAYFDVVSNSDQPFLIYTGADLVIKVIGTSFSVRSEKGEVLVQVLSGMVALYDADREKDILLLEKGESGRHNSSGFSKKVSANPNNLGWKTGKLVFRNALLADVASDLTRYSGKPVSIRGQGMESIVLTSIFENQDLFEILEEIKLVLNIDYSITEDTIILHPTGR